jgi:gamma-glutamylcysteine synthetase
VPARQPADRLRPSRPRSTSNHAVVARRGRERGLVLRRDGRPVAMLDWARELLDQMQGICELLDEGDPTRPYTAALATQAAKLDDVALTPSARLIKELRDTGESFFDLALRMSRQHKAISSTSTRRTRRGSRSSPARPPNRSRRRVRSRRSVTK